MTKKQQIFRKDLLAKIHIHTRYKEIKQAGFWAEWLSVRYDVDSCRYLSINELKEVLDILNGRKLDRDYALVDSVGRIALKGLRHKNYITCRLSKSQALHIAHLFNAVRYFQHLFDIKKKSSLQIKKTGWV